MTRVRKGGTKSKRHRKVLDQTAGYRGARSRHFRAAKEQLIHSLRYSYRDRRNKKRDFRRLWVTRINAAARQNGISYSRFIAGLRRAEVELDRKQLAELALADPAAFASLAEVAREHSPAT